MPSAPPQAAECAEQRTRFEGPPGRAGFIHGFRRELAAAPRYRWGNPP
jgi:hypothetical protein